MVMSGPYHAQDPDDGGQFHDLDPNCPGRCPVCEGLGVKQITQKIKRYPRRYALCVQHAKQFGMDSKANRKDWPAWVRFLVGDESTRRSRRSHGDKQWREDSEADKTPDDPDATPFLDLSPTEGTPEEASEKRDGLLELLAKSRMTELELLAVGLCYLVGFRQDEVGYMIAGGRWEKKDARRIQGAVARARQKLSSARVELGMEEGLI